MNTSPSDTEASPHGLSARQIRETFSGGWVIGSAIAACIGAYLELSASVWFIVAIGAACLRWRRVGALMAVALLVGVLANRSLDGLNAELPGTVSDRVQLVADPEWIGSSVRVDVRAGGRRFESWSRGTAAAAMADLASGETALVRGDVEPFASEWTPRRARHVAGRLQIVALSQPGSASGPVGLANQIRRLVVEGAGSLSHRDRVLLTGFTVGDDRQQLPEVTDDFRAAGLTHLTAVSGQNVAFVLLLIRPILRRLGPVGRLALVIAMLLQFGLITRWEPSVMRAIAMAIAAAASHLGARPRSGLPLLAGVVTLLLVIDPMLVHSIGFRMSVFASVGIATLSKRLAIRIGGPAWIADPLALTLAAQIGVAPIVLASFGSMPLVSIPANLLAGPASGPLMAWGLTAGPLAGLLGGAAAALLHIPTQLMTGYLAAVARIAASVDGPDIDVRKALLLVALFGGAWLIRTASIRRLVVATAVVVALWPVAATFDVKGADLHRANGTTVLVIDRPSPSRLLSELRTSRLDVIDLFVVVGGSAGALRATDAVQKRVEVRQTIGADVDLTGAGLTLSVGPFEVSVDRDGDRLRVRVEAARLSGG